MQVEEDVDPRRVLLLWFVRNALGVEELDAYEYVFEQAHGAQRLSVRRAFLSDAERTSPVCAPQTWRSSSPTREPA